jgi:hypothetical protein
MRIYELLLIKFFSSPNKVLILLNRMLSHTTHKHGLNETYCFVFVKEKLDPFIFLILMPTLHTLSFIMLGIHCFNT